MLSGVLDRLRPAFGLRLAAWYAGLFVVSASALFALTYHLFARSLERRDHDMVASTLGEFASQFEAGGLEALRRALELGEQTGADPDLFVRVLGAAHDTVLLRLPSGWTETPASIGHIARTGVAEWSSVAGKRGGERLELGSLRLADGTLFEVGRSTKQREQVLERFREILAAMLALVLISGLTGGALFTRSALRPLRELSRVVGGIIDTGQLSERVAVRDGPDPLDALARLVNTMLGRIESLVAGMRASLDNVAHDLRTPLTRLRVILEAALEGPNPAKARDAIADALEEVERVTGTLNALMDLSEAESGALRLQLETVAAGSMLGQALELYSDLAEDKGISLTCNCPETLAVLGDGRRLRQVFANLLDNAVKYTPGGGRIAIEARDEGGEVVINVTDTGPGIPPGDQARIWERLYRADQSRSERGLGLGLSLVRAIVHSHGGTTAVESEPGKGTRFTIRLPSPPAASR